MASGTSAPRRTGFSVFFPSPDNPSGRCSPLGPRGSGIPRTPVSPLLPGNPLLVSLETLTEWGLVSAEDLRNQPAFPDDSVDYGPVMTWKMPILRTAAARFLDRLRDGRPKLRSGKGSSPSRPRRPLGWKTTACSLRSSRSLMPARQARVSRAARGIRPGTGTSRSEHLIPSPGGGRSWLGKSRSNASSSSSSSSSGARSARRLAGSGYSIIGDLPIFAAPDSADVWANRDLFQLDADGRPTVVSGVPPDYFAKTGQLWGNPLYDWDALGRQEYRFWVERIRSARKLFDFVRIDHFRGFEACWTVPAGESTAERGRWMKAPGVALFDALLSQLGKLPLIAEDLGRHHSRRECSS